jgi:hypothetical protein
MNSFTFWQKWLYVVGLVLVLFGLALAFFNQTAVFDFLFNHQIDPVFWGGQPIGSDAALFQRWAYGVLGATVAGWGIFLAFIAQYPFRRKERWAWTCVAVGLGSWYLVDTGLSLRAGVWFNALFNGALLILACLPLAFTWKEFHIGSVPHSRKRLHRGGHD